LILLDNFDDMYYLINKQTTNLCFMTQTPKHICRVSKFQDHYVFDFDNENYLMPISYGFWESVKYIETSKKIKLILTQK
jgi:hypothetical protein